MLNLFGGFFAYGYSYVQGMTSIDCFFQRSILEQFFNRSSPIIFPIVYNTAVLITFLTLAGVWRVGLALLYKSVSSVTGLIAYPCLFNLRRLYSH